MFFPNFFLTYALLMGAGMAVNYVSICIVTLYSEMLRPFRCISKYCQNCLCLCRRAQQLFTFCFHSLANQASTKRNKPQHFRTISCVLEQWLRYDTLLVFPCASWRYSRFVQANGLMATICSIPLCLSRLARLFKLHTWGLAPML